MEKHLYYVTMETGEIHHRPFDDQVNYYEVHATEEEITHLEGLFSDLHETEYYPEIKEPFNDKLGKVVRSDQRVVLDEITDAIYAMGTPETKENIKTIKKSDQRL